MHGAPMTWYCKNCKSKNRRTEVKNSTMSSSISASGMPVFDFTMDIEEDLSRDTAPPAEPEPTSTQEVCLRYKNCIDFIDL